MLLRGFAEADAPRLIEAVNAIAQRAAFRHLVVPGGHTMSVAMTNCGRVGWVSDRSGYRYDPLDPATGKPWPAMPPAFLDLATRAATDAGFPDYDPDACLIWVCPRRFYGAASAARIRSGVCAWNRVTWSCGAVPHASFITASLRSRTAIIL